MTATTNSKEEQPLDIDLGYKETLRKLNKGEFAKELKRYRYKPDIDMRLANNKGESNG